MKRDEEGYFITGAAKGDNVGRSSCRSRVW
jgi:hypothetical protein